jgi:hypothetical protein
MALTFTEIADSRQNIGPSMIIQLNIATPAASDYPTGGYPLYSSAGSAPNNVGQPFGMGYLYGCDIIASTGTAAAYSWAFNRTTGKMQVFGTGASAGAALQEVAAATDLSGGTVTMCAFGF